LSAVPSSAEILRKNLIKLRDRHNITQEQAAIISGLEYKYYQDVEAGRREQIRLVTLDKLAKAYCLKGAQLISERLPASRLMATTVPLGRVRAKPRRKRKAARPKPLASGLGVPNVNEPKG
jgi:transcriptional regulator with XRE-family HTH domain